MLLGVDHSVSSDFLEQSVKDKRKEIQLQLKATLSYFFLLFCKIQYCSSHIYLCRGLGRHLEYLVRHCSVSAVGMCTLTYTFRLVENVKTHRNSFFKIWSWSSNLLPRTLQCSRDEIIGRGTMKRSFIVLGWSGAPVSDEGSTWQCILTHSLVNSSAFMEHWQPGIQSRQDPKLQNALKSSVECALWWGRGEGWPLSDQTHC